MSLSCRPVSFSMLPGPRFDTNCHAAVDPNAFQRRLFICAKPPQAFVTADEQVATLGRWRPIIPTKERNDNVSIAIWGTSSLNASVNQSPGCMFTEIIGLSPASSAEWDMYVRVRTPRYLKEHVIKSRSFNLMAPPSHAPISAYLPLDLHHQRSRRMARREPWRRRPADPHDSRDK